MVAGYWREKDGRARTSDLVMLGARKLGKFRNTLELEPRGLESLELWEMASS